MTRCVFMLFCFLASCVTILHADDLPDDSIFNGKDLTGWQGDEKFWSVQGGTIVGQSTPENPTKGNTFLIWQGGQPGDFEFRCQVRVTGNNSGVQYRSKKVRPNGYVLAGYQADLHPKPEYMGMMYGEKTGRGIIATGGLRLKIGDDGSVVKERAFQPLENVKADQWNEVRIVAVGNRMIHQVNGHTTIDVSDNDPRGAQSGWLGLQLHAGNPMKAEFKQLQLRQLSGDDAKALVDEAANAGAKEKQTVAPDDGADAAADLKINPSEINVPDGFVVELVHAVEQDQGSWVSLTLDPKGRIYACDQRDAGLYRITTRSGEPAIVEKVSKDALADVTAAQGMYWAGDSLWFHQNGGNLLRLTDTDGDDQLDHVETLPSTTGSGEHGNHAVLPTADGKEMFLVGGNHAPLADQRNSRVPVWYEGLLLPRMTDPRGHARSRFAPGGWITRVDPATYEQELQSIGYRNQYDIALNSLGDLFTYDADMEWDLGLPWYRPTRICFAASGSDFGWRNGSGKWPSYYEDSLPSVVDIGPGSPTGLVSGSGTSFPSRYQDALFALDWTYGTMYAIHLKADGAGYRGERETFLWGVPLPLTDAVVDQQGNLVFAIGGRGTQSRVYRVRYTGDQDSAKQQKTTDKTANAAALKRMQLETYHGRLDPSAIADAWPLLSSDDRFLRHAARIAVESQPVETWADRVAKETDPQAFVTASVALARMGDPSHQPKLIDGLQSIDLASLSESQLLGALRAYALAFLRLQEPTKAQRVEVMATLDPMLPHASDDVNTELIRLLAYLRSDTVVAKTMNLILDPTPTGPPAWSELAKRNERYGTSVREMLQAHPPTRALGYASLIRNLRQGWSLDLRRSYFAFLNEAAKSSGGASYPGYLNNIRQDALASCSTAERESLQDVTGEDFNPKPDFAIVDPVGPGQKWTVGDAMAAMVGKPDLHRGRSLYFSAKCGTCHRMAGLGGDVGPDVTSLRNKFDQKYVIEAIVHPSKDISDQYGSSRVLTDDGQIYTGLAVEDKANEQWIIYPVDENAKMIRVDRDAVELIEPSTVSQMPEGLLDRLNETEVRDLVGYLLSGGEGIEE